jgi:riboflavin kinase/FMN adenylyltransferase
MGDLYGKNLQVRFVKKLRENKKFESVEKLKEQLEKDVRRVMKDD